MAEISLADVVERIKAEGQLQRNSGTNSLKSIKDILSGQNEIMSEGFKGLVSAITADALSNKELKMENDRLNERLLQALQDLKAKETGAGVDVPGLPPLGLLGGALALAIGSALGVIQGQLKAISAFSKLFTPDWVKLKFEAVKATMGTWIDNFRIAVGERITAIRTGITNGIERFKSFFTIAEDSPLYKLGQSLRAKIDGLVDIFRPIGATITGIAEGSATRLGNVWTTIKGYFTTLGDKVGIISRTVAKVFAPIAIITTAWDTITATIEGWQENGILGALEGAITGFFTSLVTIPFDLVKSAVAWVFEKLGWDPGAEFLNSFSFTEIFTNLVSGVFGYIEGAVDFFKSLFAWDSSNPVVAALTDVSEFLTGMVQTVKDFMVESFNKVVNAIQSFDLMATLGNIGNLAEEFLKNLLRAVLPAADSLVFEAPSVSILGREFGGGQINLNPIPDSLYEWLNQPVPEVTPIPAASGASGDELSAAEQRLQETTTEREVAQAEGSAGSTVVADASTKIESRSDTVYVGTDLSARAPNPWDNVDYNDPRMWQGG